MASLNSEFSFEIEFSNLLSSTCHLSERKNTKSVHSDSYKINKHIPYSQEERRRAKLAIQKKERTRVFDLARDLENIENENTKLECVTDTKPYENQLMYSEWFENTPEDFELAWRVILCPIGKRSLVIAHNGVTRVYSRSGILVNTFHSELPGGNPTSHKQYTILDCIYCAGMRTYYMLDVMIWNSHPVYDCDTEFR